MPGFCLNSFAMMKGGDGDIPSVPQQVNEAAAWEQPLECGDVEAVGWGFVAKSKDLVGSCLSITSHDAQDP